LINIVDSSDSNMIQMIRTTQNVLSEIGVKDVPMITAYNKADKTDRNYPQIEGSGILYSATDSESIKLLAQLITKRVFASYQKVNLVVPLADGKALANLHEYAQIILEEYKTDGVHVTARLAPEKQAQFHQYIV